MRMQDYDEYARASREGKRWRAESRLKSRFADGRTWRLSHVSYRRGISTTIGGMAAFGQLYRAYLKDKSDESFRAIVQHTTTTHPEVAHRTMGKLFPDFYEYFWGSESTEVPWEHKSWFAASPYYCLHAVRASEEDPAQVAFFASVEKMERGIRTRCKPGRYLQKYFSDVLSEEEIRRWANAHITKYAPAEVRFAYSESDCVRVVNEGPGSCMAAVNHDGDYHWYVGHVHPAAVYGHPDGHPDFEVDTCVAYIEDEHGRVTARAVCNKKDKTYVRIYGDEEKLYEALTRLGWEQKSGALEGCRVRCIWDRNGDGHILPYFDAGIASQGGSMNYDVDGRYLVITCEGAYDSSDGYNYGGVSVDPGTRSCDYCGNHVHEDDLTFVEGEGYVCPGCLDRHFTYARTGRHTSEYVRDDDTVYCESDGEQYSQYALDECGIAQCEVSGDYYFERDLVMTSEGPVHPSEAVELSRPDSEGNDYAVPQDTRMLPNGDEVHRDTYDEALAEYEAEQAAQEAEQEESAA